MTKRRIINTNTPKAEAYQYRHGRWALNCPAGIAPTLTTAHHFSGNITHPRQGFREVGVMIDFDANEKAI
jgi:hypothetical protein